MFESGQERGEAVDAVNAVFLKREPCGAAIRLDDSTCRPIGDAFRRQRTLGRQHGHKVHGFAGHSDASDGVPHGSRTAKPSGGPSTMATR